MVVQASGGEGATDSKSKSTRDILVHDTGHLSTTGGRKIFRQRCYRANEMSGFSGFCRITCLLQVSFSQASLGLWFALGVGAVVARGHPACIPGFPGGNIYGSYGIHQWISWVHRRGFLRWTDPDIAGYNGLLGGCCIANHSLCWGDSLGWGGGALLLR